MVYDFLYTGLALTHDEMYEIFNEWNNTELDSYLIEITRDIMKVKDSDGSPLVEKILDRAGQKGTGKWTGINSLELGVPITLIIEAVYARSLSALKNERVEASELINGPMRIIEGERAPIIEDVRKALLASKIVSYAQGYMLMREASKEYGWSLNYGGIALMWRGGCIIRSAFLGKIKEAFDLNPTLNNLLVDPYFLSVMADCQTPWRRTLSRAITAGIPMPAMTSALSFFDGYRSERLPANLLQAQRDYFGAHTYERVDQKEGEYFHTNWSGEGGNVSSSTYEV